MSFYGNITDVRPTHFQFDKIFSNRAEMDRELELGIDNVFAGRFVLVRYDTDNSYVGDIIYGYRGCHTKWQCPPAIETTSRTDEQGTVVPYACSL